MRIIESKYIVDAPGCRTGQSVEIACLENESDSDLLYENILTSNYYNRAYFEQKTGFIERRLTLNLWFVASLIRKIRPRKCIELGSGKGDTIEVLQKNSIDSYGIDFSHDMKEQLSEQVKDKFYFGDIADVSRSLSSAGRQFDTVIGLDIWEHLLPKEIHHYIEAACSLLSEDGFIFAVIPAFGSDPVFGEQFPLELEENRQDMEKGTTFKHIPLESNDPPIPCSGHLIWAPAVWWERTFTNAGLTRAVSIERRLHKIFDRMLPHSNKSFFVFHRDSDRARERARDIEQRLLSMSPVLQLWLNIIELLVDSYILCRYKWAFSPIAYVADRFSIFDQLMPLFRKIRSRL